MQFMDMFRLDFLLPIALGFAVVLQGGLNRQIARDWGMGGAAVFNACVLFVFAWTICMIVADLKPKFAVQAFRWWFILPGILGFCLVAGIPIAIAKLGAVRVFIGLIAAQLIGSMLWDIFMESIPVSWPRVAGIALAFLGVVISSL